MSGDILGYIVVAWVGDTHLQTLGRQILHDDIEWARDAARGMQEQAGTAGDNVRYEVHPVFARTNGGSTLRGRLVAAAKLPADVDEEVLVAEIEARFKGTVRAVVGHGAVLGQPLCECGDPMPTRGDWMAHVEALRAQGVPTATLTPAAKDGS